MKEQNLNPHASQRRLDRIVMSDTIIVMRDDWEKCTSCACSNCGNSNVYHYEDDSGDLKHKCGDCGNTWFVDGPDS